MKSVSATQRVPARSRVSDGSAGFTVVSDALDVLDVLEVLEVLEVLDDPPHAATTRATAAEKVMSRNSRVFMLLGRW